MPACALQTRLQDESHVRRCTPGRRTFVPSSASGLIRRTPAAVGSSSGLRCASSYSAWKPTGIIPVSDGSTPSIELMSSCRWISQFADDSLLLTSSSCCVRTELRPSSSRDSTHLRLGKFCWPRWMDGWRWASFDGRAGESSVRAQHLGAHPPVCLPPS